MFTKIYQTLLKEVEKTSKWKNILCIWVRKLNIVKTAILLKANQKCNEMSIIIPIIFGRNIKIYPKILLKSQVT